MSHPYPTVPPSVDEESWYAAVAAVRSYCGWHIAPEVTETVTIDGSGSSLQILPTMRLVDLVSITNDGTAVDSPEWSHDGFVRRSCWTRKLRGVVAEMTHGYEVWPDELESVTVELVAGAARAGVKAVTSGSHQVSFETTLSSSQLGVLDRYRLPSVS